MGPSEKLLVLGASHKTIGHDNEDMVKCTVFRVLYHYPDSKYHALMRGGHHDKSDNINI